MRATTIFIQSLPAKVGAALIFILHLAGSCSDPSEIGLVLDPNTNRIGVFYTEIPLSASMVLYDSFNTTSQGRLVVGGDVDDFFGKTESIGYSRLSYNPGAAKPNNEAIFDSAVFSINIQSMDGINFEEPKTYRVHKLEEAILDTSYYNFDALRFSEETIAEGDFILRPDTTSTIRMALDPNFAGELFGKLTSNDPAFSNIFTFREYFPGIAITGDPNQNANASIAVGNGTGMILYYHYENDTVSRTFPINTLQSRHFNGVTSDRRGTPTESIVERGVEYQLEGNKIGGKSTLGLFVKLNTDPLEDFLDTLDGVTFNQIMLEVGPVDEYPEFKWPSGNMLMYFTAENNRLYQRADGAVVAVQMEGASQIGLDLQGNPVPTATNQSSLIIDRETRAFRNQITSYVNAIYRNGLIRTDLTLYPNFPSNDREPVSSDESKRSLRQYILDKDKVMLKVYYTKAR